MADPARKFAERRGITFRERVAEVVRKIVPEKARSIFAGFKPAPEHQLDIAAEPKTSAPLNIERTVARYARAVDEIGRASSKGLEPLPHQIAARDKAYAALNEGKPNAARDLSSAFNHQPDLVSQAANGRSANALCAMQLEAEIRTNPQMRANRFVENWQRLHRQRERLLGTGDQRSVCVLTGQMESMAKGLERDPQVDSLLRNRKIELGLGARSSGGIGQQLMESVGLRRDRSLGISM